MRLDASIFGFVRRILKVWRRQEMKEMVVRIRMVESVLLSDRSGGKEGRCWRNF
jgi:hypothetical protein